MRLAQGGRAGQRVDVVNGGDVAGDGRLLSVAEIQQALRELRSARTVPAPARRSEPAHGAQAHEQAPHEELSSDTAEGNSTAADGSTGRLGEGWVAMVAAHSGAGASTVALAVADAAAAGRRVHLVETAHPARSGLLTAASAELGVDATGTWRRGDRRGLRIDRRAGEPTPDGWPELTGGPAGLTVIDLGLPAPAGLARLAERRPRTVVVCRPTVPGVRLAEQLLTRLPGPPVAVACVGERRWPGEVSASVGPLLAGLRATGRLVPVPLDRHLAVTGPGSGPLPKPVAAAGRVLLELIDAARPEQAATISARSAPSTKGTNR